MKRSVTRKGWDQRGLSFRFSSHRQGMASLPVTALPMETIGKVTGTAAIKKARLAYKMAATASG
ncbi:MAG: hypothetical protein MK538_05645 [Planctomycetes bacterium]|nr:hypothetical protein [Planctomycetota bacterium]